MHNVNSWLMVLSFVLGLLLTFAFMIRRVTREEEEPVAGALGRASVDAPTAEFATGSASVDAPTAEFATGGAAKVADVPAGPFGAGSAKAGAGGSGPDGWTIKGNEDSMLYHAPESPWYGQTIAEVWFRDEKTAQAAGFTRWDEHKASGGAAKVADVPPGPFGAGSAKAGAGGSGPDGWTVKGNEDSMLYHSPESPAYDATIAEVWFRDEKTAKAAGFARWDSWRKK